MVFPHVGVMIAAFTGNLLTVLFVIFGFEKVKKWLESRRKKAGKGESKRTERGTQIWNKYGMPGVALLGPIFIGTHIAAFIGLLFGAKKVQCYGVVDCQHCTLDTHIWDCHSDGL